MSTSFTFNIQNSSNPFSSNRFACWTHQDYSDVMEIDVQVFPSEKMEEIEMTAPNLTNATPWVQVIDTDSIMADC
jgi:hypothetical protein